MKLVLRQSRLIRWAIRSVDGFPVRAQLSEELVVSCCDGNSLPDLHAGLVTDSRDVLPNSILWIM